MVGPKRIVVVTGASRGAGKGIAAALGETGAKVYVTGRTRNEGDAPLPGTVFATAEEITRRGGQGVPVMLLHARSCLWCGQGGGGQDGDDMAVDFRPWNVAVVSIWMGLLRTERTLAGFAANPGAYEGLAVTAESPEFTGRVIDALARDPQLMNRTGQVLIGAEIAQELGVEDTRGQRPPSHRPFLGNPPVFSDAVID